MLDNEPDTNNVSTNDTSSSGAPAEASSAPAPRRRRAATRKAGPPVTPPVMTAETPAVESAPAPDAPAPDSPTPDAPAAETPAPAKKTTRKRATKAAGDAPKTPRKRASKKSAAAAPAADQPADAPAVDQPAATPAPDAEAALDEIKLSLSAELPPKELTEPAEEQDPAEDDEAAQIAVAEAEEAAPVDPDAEPPAADAPSVEPAAADAEPADGPVTDGPVTDGSVTGDSDEDADDESGDSDDASAEGDESGGQRRRRRRRGGRRRRRGGDGDGDDDSRGGSSEQSGESSGDRTEEPPSGSSEDPVAAKTGADSADDDDPSAEDGSDEGGQRRRRRRRRRRGEDSQPSADDPAEVVVRVREPRSRQKAAEEVTGISGSTRMEAKRQRRREGREAGRRRAPILSEAEFLARRESVVRRMIVRQRDELSQIAVLEDDILVEHYVDRESAASLIGNVYLGRVQNVLPSMEAAFIDIGRGRNAVLYAGEVDWDAFGANGQQRKVENVLKSGQTVLVQVTKDPVGAKGARLTSHVTLPGRYIVYAPGGHLSGISRKLPDNERKRLKSVLNDLVPESASVIVRTAAEGASEDELVRDVNRLKAQWDEIERKVKAGSAPKLLYGEPDLTVRIVRDLFTEDFAELVIQGNGSGTDAYDAVDAYVGHVAPHLHDRLRRWDGDSDGDLFASYRLDEQIAKALERKVFLPSGGSLIIDRTEAMTVIDVNTGKFTGSGGNLEATVTSNNLEAAEEIVRQLRLRDVGGIIVIDFIDMVLPSNRELLLRRLVECLGRDRTRHQVAEVTSLGLVQMTRKKIGTGLLEAFTTECEHCHGRGYAISDVPVETQKQPDGGSRDQRGGGGGGGRGRGRGNQSNSQGSSNGSPKQPVHQPIPAALRPDHSGAKSQPAEADPAVADVTSEPAGDDQPVDETTSAPEASESPVESEHPVVIASAT